MKRKKNILMHIASALLTTLLLWACGSKNTSTIMRTNITGKAGEMVIVISEEAWEGAPGKTLRQTLAQPMIGLPQDEPLFNLINIPQEAFKDIFRTTRNIIQTQISPNVSKPGVSFIDDPWAYPQATVQIKAKTPEEFVQLFSENSDKILRYFLAAEKERITMNYKKVYEKSIYNLLSKDFGITMRVPPGFRVMKQAKDFLWVQYDTPEIFQGIIVYTFPYRSDSAFTANYQIPIRDSILHAHVPGPTEGSYMMTERQIPPVVNALRHHGNYAVEMRGLWRVANDYMGGPYVSLSILDLANQRVINALGFVYAPSKDKRNYVRQIEAMLYSIELNNQEENDKLNKQDIEIEVKG